MSERDPNCPEPHNPFFVPDRTQETMYLLFAASLGPIGTSVAVAMVSLTVLDISVIALHLLLALLMFLKACRLRRYRLRRLREVDELWQQIEGSERPPA